jgi:hypothetical protein
MLLTFDIVTAFPWFFLVDVVVDLWGVFLLRNPACLWKSHRVTAAGRPPGRDTLDRRAGLFRRLR